MVTWNGATTGSTSGNIWYRFRVREVEPLSDHCRPMGLRVVPTCLGNNFSTLQDYGPGNTLTWTASDHEGLYEIEVSARDNSTGAVATTASQFEFLPRVTGGTPVLSPTANALVFLYSAPPCPAGSMMSVQFQATGTLLQTSNSKSCDGRTSMNFYIAGMLPQTVYSIQHVLRSGAATVLGPVLQQMTGEPDPSLDYGARTLNLPPAASLPNPVLLQARFGNPVATDLNGNIIWYSLQNISFLARPEPGGLFLGWLEGSTFDTAHQTLVEFDLAGTVLRQTNAARVNQQLTAMGMHSINSFHHDARAIPGGGILTLAAEERILTGVQGAGPVDVLGDMIIVLDQNMQVVWAWDTFDHLDTTRMATMNETCTAVTGGCPPLLLANQANDWTHGNSIQLTPDGDILYSARHQDLVFKIDYQNGRGTGNVVWRLGKGGDFQFLSSDPYPWFSHQHDANIDASGIVTVFDNGNVRQAADASANSRGQAIQLDENNMTAKLIVNADLGDFSIALGSAQMLPDGNYHFHMGDIVAKNSTTRAVEVEPTGQIVYDMGIREIMYRSFRMQDLYTPPGLSSWVEP